MRQANLILRWGVALAALLAVAACDMPLRSSATPKARPAGLGQPAIQPTSEKSAALRSYFVQVQAAQLRQGLLREDGGGPDTPFTPDMLARNFEDIVFYNEYASALQGRGGESPLRRWEGPVRIDTIFGAGVPPSVRKAEDARIRDYARRLGRITAHPVNTLGPSNFIVIVAGEDDRDAALNTAAARISGITARSLDPLRDLGRDTYCAVAAYASGADANTYTAAVAVIRAENPDLLRLSCIHEELAQGLGLANDSRDARPSIFNDDDEFALLTAHDELLLKMLYDPRLKTGMSAAEAAPITRIIARELTNSGPL
ncbi:DUF2927 domain-containing protein [Roseobacter denitrificans]|uniref:Lipoprotein, putative n=1 Tax=Roseobacter denitrificans (strain ATCC 33942 / OCh 114) TaxID=375451 RepID=Q168K1_ROSDO|nr:DUF2927 domain-containing protein [Roseobacter denitrificans]ABG31592.1 lipoprotein, putative [Roseobacter denitrificans OCh 114]AVL54582.1 DUF2927 domain-containing protein [Roseobacter denitrificans]SFF89518.1 Protein of unknown function [Roseobacter denitrificans OCh 114]